MAELVHVMFDLETLGTVPGCVGLSIGAVEFRPHTGELGDTFYVVIDVDSSLDHFLTEDPDTVQWWLGQSEEARAVLTEARSGNASSLPDAMNALNAWLAKLGPGSKIRSWGNGADFDNPILRVMYDAANVKPYAGSYGGRCYRTVKNLDELFGEFFKFEKLDRGRDRVGVHHNALDDAKSQAIHLMRNIALIKEKMK